MDAAAFGKHQFSERLSQPAGNWEREGDQHIVKLLQWNS
jgi:hypothetical protein